MSTSLCDDCYRTQSASLGKLTGVGDDLVGGGGESRSTSIRDLNKSASPPRQNIVEDDNGYCEIDYTWSAATPVGQTVQSADGHPPQPPPPNSSNPVAAAASSSVGNGGDLKRQSTVSADSIPEETEHEMNALMPAAGQQKSQDVPPPLPPPSRSQSGSCTIQRTVSFNNKNVESGGQTTTTTETTTNVEEVVGGAVERDETIPNISIPNESFSHFEINDAYDSTSLVSF